MKTHGQLLDEKEVSAWVSSVGGFAKAAQLIEAKLGCSDSKAEKLAAANYPHKLKPLEKAALTDLMSRPIWRSGPFVGAKGSKRKAS